MYILMCSGTYKCIHVAFICAQSLMVQNMTQIHTHRIQICWRNYKFIHVAFICAQSLMVQIVTQIHTHRIHICSGNYSNVGHEVSKCVTWRIYACVTWLIYVEHILIFAKCNPVVFWSWFPTFNYTKPHVCVCVCVCILLWSIVAHTIDTQTHTHTHKQIHTYASNPTNTHIGSFAYTYILSHVHAN